MSDAILSAGLWVGTFDIIAAMILTLLRGGSIEKLFQFIASGVFGSKAFSGGVLYAAYGLLFHYLIALVWAMIFFLIARKFPTILRQKVLTGILYGVLVWLGMNLVVLPLARTPNLPINMTSAAIGMCVLIIAIGLPLSYLAARFFFRRGSSRARRVNPEAGAYHRGPKKSIRLSEILIRYIKKPPSQPTMSM